MVRKLLLLPTLLVVASSFAQTQQEQADDAIAWGSANNEAVEAAAGNGDPATLVPGYAGTPLTDYYENQSSGALEADARNAVMVSPDPTTEYAWGQSNTPMLEFSETDPLLVDSWRIQDNTAVVEGELVMTGTECVEGRLEVPQTTVERCTAWTLPEEAFCDNVLEVGVEVNPRVYTAVVQVVNDVGRPFDGDTLTIGPQLNDPAWQVDFGIGANGEHIGFARVERALGLPDGFDCASVTDVSVDIDGNFIEVATPVCSAGNVFARIRYNSGPFSGGNVTYTITAGDEIGRAHV